MGICYSQQYLWYIVSVKHFLVRYRAKSYYFNENLV